MKLRLLTDDPDEIAMIRMRIPAVMMQLEQWRQVMLESIANQVFVDTLQRRMEAAGIHKKIVQGTAISNVEYRVGNKARIHFRSEYFSDEGFDVALAREKGTRRHFVAPVRRKALSWIQGGVRRFSRGHWVKGLPALRTIERTVDEMGPAFRERWLEEQRRWLAENLGGGVDAG